MHEVGSYMFLREGTCGEFCRGIHMILNGLDIQGWKG